MVPRSLLCRDVYRYAITVESERRDGFTADVIANRTVVMRDRFPDSRKGIALREEKGTRAYVSPGRPNKGSMFNIKRKQIFLASVFPGVSCSCRFFIRFLARR